MKKYFFALALVAALAGQGQAASAANTGTGVSKASAPPQARGRVLSDAQIERNIRARLARSKMSGKEHFTFSVQSGVVTLEGKTSVIQHKGTATRIARLSGAVAVENHIQISDEARAKATARLARYRAGGMAAGAVEPSGPLRASVIPPKRP